MTNPLQDHARDRVVAHLGTEAAIRRGLAPKDALPTPAELARQQVADAIARGRMDLSGSPRWPFADLDRLIGPMLPGEFWVVAALTGNGKSSLLMSAMDGWAKRECSTLYIPLEIDPPEMRRRWAAWRLGLDPVLVAQNAWAQLPAGARDQHEAELAAQPTFPYVHFVPDKQITIERIERWMQWGYKELAVRQVILDHFQRVTHGPQATAAHRLAVALTAQRLRDKARDLGLVVIAAAQVLRNLEPLDAYRPPLLSRIQDSSGIAQEASGVLVLSRKLRSDVSKGELAGVREGRVEEWRLAEPNVMTVTCRKHRLDDRARDRRVVLAVRNGRVENLLHYEPRGIIAPEPEEDLWTS